MKTKKKIIPVLLMIMVIGTLVFALARDKIPVWFLWQKGYYKQSETDTASPLTQPSLSVINHTPSQTPSPEPTQTPKKGLSPNEGPPLDFSILPDGRLDINLANRQQLISLPGIGEAISLRIIEYRDANGPFLEFDELLKVQGIKPDVCEMLKQYAGVSFEQ